MDNLSLIVDPNFKYNEEYNNITYNENFFGSLGYSIKNLIIANHETKYKSCLENLNTKTENIEMRSDLS